MHRHPPLRRLVACILLPCSLLACATWKTHEASPQQVLADEQPDKVRVTLTDGSQVVLKQPVVSGDTLTGLSARTPPPGISAAAARRAMREGQQVSIPLASVSGLELHKGEIGKTILLGTGIVVGVAGLAFVLVCSTSECFR